MHLLLICAGEIHLICEVLSIIENVRRAQGLYLLMVCSKGDAKIASPGLARFDK